MKPSVTSLAVLFALMIANAGGVPGPGSLADAFKNPPPGYGEVPFWWWTGEKLDKERLAWELEELHAKGVSGTQVNYSHLMTDGWKSVPMEPKVFSDEWWDVFAFAAAKSAELGMGIGLSGYTLDWPGRDNLFRELGISTDETRGRVLELKDGKVVPVVRDGTLDPLNPESARRVIDRFFRPFWEKLPASSQAALNYFFQDELRLSGDAFVWCEDFPQEFQRRKGYDVVPKLPLLFAGEVTDEVAKVRLDYNDVMVALEEERYFKPIYEWHASRGKIYACDPASRGNDPIEFGDYMRAMRWYTAPGFDTPGGKADPVKCKMGSSISHLYRRPRVWLEGYHSQGWQANTASIFAATARNYAWGANLLNLHGLYYSTYGGWWEWAPPCYHFHQPYWQLMGATLKYFERLSYLLTRGDHVCDVAIVSPQEPCVVDDARARKSSVPLAHAIVKRLAVDGCTDCDFIDADSLSAAVVTNDALGAGLAVAGECYRAVILPDMFVMCNASKAKLAAFAKAGGKVVDAKRAEDVPLPVVAHPDVTGHVGLKYHHRRTSEHDIYYLVDWNFTDPIRLRARGELEFWDAWTGDRLAAPRRGEPVLAVVRRGGNADSIASIASMGGKGGDAMETIASTIPLNGPWRMTIVPTQDNRWGDYRLPATKELMGPEVRRMYWVEEKREVQLGYGPQFVDETDWRKHFVCDFSWRYGTFDQPGAQNNHHGLNRAISDCFIVLGPYSRQWPAPYDVVPPAEGDMPTRHFMTYVYAPRNLRARIVNETERPQAIFPETAGRFEAPKLVKLVLEGKSVKPDDIVELKRGFARVDFAYRGYGRAALVFVDVDAKGPAPARRPLAMKWDSMPGVLKYVPFPRYHADRGPRRVGTFVATVPPGTCDAEVKVNGLLLVKRIEDEKLILQVEFTPEGVGGGVFEDVIRLKTIPEQSELGDWSRWEGMRCYSGGVRYEKSLVADDALVAGDGRLELDLGAVGCCAAVRVNGGEEMVRTCPPWTFDVSKRIRAGENQIEVTVYNTANNHYQTIPTRYKVPAGDAPSGLLGPVKLRKFAR